MIRKTETPCLIAYICPKIIQTVKAAIKNVTDGIDIHSIGITGQMHGILYLDKNLTPCSPLIIWQDARGNEIFKSNETYAEYLTKVTGIKAASGYGLTTHFYNIKNNLVPQNAFMLCTIHDYLAALLTNTKPVSHTSDAASLGFFDLEKLDFNKNALQIAGIDTSFLPDVIKDTVTEEDFNSLLENPTLKFTAYAIQCKGMASAQDAWRVLNSKKEE